MAKKGGDSKSSKKTAQKKGGGTKAKANKRVQEKMYGDRDRAHHLIMTMEAEDLHEEYPFTEELVFNQTMKKKDFNQKKVPDESCLIGTKKDGKIHRFVIGNEQGEILPQLLNAKWQCIESNKVYGNPMTITTTLEEKEKSKYLCLSRTDDVFMSCCSVFG